MKKNSKHSPRLLNLFQGKITPTMKHSKYETPELKKSQKTMLKSVLNDIWKSKQRRGKVPKKAKKQFNYLGKRRPFKYTDRIDLTEQKETQFVVQSKKVTRVERLRILEEKYKKFEERYFESQGEVRRDGKASCISKINFQLSSPVKKFSMQKKKDSKFGQRNKHRGNKHNGNGNLRQKRAKNFRRKDQFFEGKRSVIGRFNAPDENRYFDKCGKRSVDGAIYKKLKMDNSKKLIEDKFNKKKRSLLENLEKSLKELKASTPNKYKNDSEFGFFPSDEEQEEDKQPKCFTAYSARTNMGLYRDYNEDRVSIILNILLQITPKRTQCSSFFALFDGHAGSKCADFLKDNLHHFITSQKEYINDKKTAIKKGIFKAEEEFWKLAHVGPVVDISGSCLLLGLFHDNVCYFANVGDSRMIACEQKGRKVIQLTTDHKPEDKVETNRIKTNGGDIFRNSKLRRVVVKDPETGAERVKEVVKYGPFRVSPGGLSVSRTIGDIPSKDPKLGGAQSCVVPTPEIGQYLVTSASDFIVLACDGVYDVLSNQEVVTAVWQSIERCVRFMTLEEVSRIAAESVMKASFDKRSMDNITVIVILFRKKEYYLKGRTTNVRL